MNDDIDDTPLPAFSFIDRFKYLGKNIGLG